MLLLIKHAEVNEKLTTPSIKHTPVHFPNIPQNTFQNNKSNSKGKIVLCLTKHHGTDMYGGVEV
jgi:hypothetical protein